MSAARVHHHARPSVIVPTTPQPGEFNQVGKKQLIQKPNIIKNSIILYTSITEHLRNKLKISFITKKKMFSQKKIGTTVEDTPVAACTATASAATGTQRTGVRNTGVVCDPAIDEHFKRSLGLEEYAAVFDATSSSDKTAGLSGESRNCVDS